MKITLTGITGALNSGDHALCASAIAFLQEVYPAATITGIHRDPELQSRHFPGVRWVRQIGASYATNRIRRRARNATGLGMAALKAGLGQKSTWGLTSDDQPAYAALAQADLVVGCPGGWLEDNHISIWANLIQLNVAVANRVPVFFAPQSIGPFRKALSQREAARLFGQAKAIALRDPISEKYVRETLGVSKVPLQTFPDMAFYESQADTAAADRILDRVTGAQAGRLAGTTVLEWSFPGSANPQMALQDYLGKIAESAREIYRRQNIKTIFLRQIRDAHGYEGDRTIVTRFRSEIGAAGFVCEEFLDPPVLRGVIRRCEVFWGTRLHANIFAMTQRVPVVGVAYQHKTQGIMTMMGQGDYVVPIDDFTSNQLVGLIEKALQNQAQIVSILDAKFTALAQERQKLKQFLLTHVAGPVGR